MTALLDLSATEIFRSTQQRSYVVFRQPPCYINCEPLPCRAALKVAEGELLRLTLRYTGWCLPMDYAIDPLY